MHKINLSMLTRELYLTTEEVFAFREKAVMDFTKTATGRGVNAALALGMYYNGYAHMFRADACSRDTRVWIDTDIYALWFEKHGRKFVNKRNMEELRANALKAKAEHMKGTLFNNSLHAVFGDNLRDDDGVMMAVFPKSNESIDVHTLRLWGSVNGPEFIIDMLSKCSDDEVFRTEMRSMVSRLRFDSIA